MFRKRTQLNESKNLLLGIFLTNHTTNPPRNHVRGQHEREFSFRDHQTLKQSQWKCRVCTFIFMREKAVIEEHLTESHGLTIEGYEGGREEIQLIFFGFSFGLKNVLKFYFDFETCLNYPFLNSFLL